MHLLNDFEINTLSEDGIKTLYKIFENDFITNTTHLTKDSISFPIEIKYHHKCPCPFGGSQKPKKFWHVITRDKKNPSKSNNPCLDAKEKIRAYDKARAKRIHWIKIFIDTWQTDSNLDYFYQQRGNNEDNLIIWHQNEKFLVVIRRIGSNSDRYLVSSFVIHDKEKHRYTKQLKEYVDKKPTGIEWF